MLSCSMALAPCGHKLHFRRLGALFCLYLQGLSCRMRIHSGYIWPFAIILDYFRYDVTPTQQNTYTELTFSALSRTMKTCLTDILQSYCPYLTMRNCIGFLLSKHPCRFKKAVENVYIYNYTYYMNVMTTMAALQSTT
jgi:hypothetical protein